MSGNITIGNYYNEIDEEPDLVEVEDCLNILKDIDFIFSNNVWQNEEIYGGIFFIRIKELDKFYGKLIKFIPEKLLSKKEFKSFIEGNSKKDEDLNPNYYFINFHETENLPRKLINIIDIKHKSDG